MLFVRDYLSDQTVRRAAGAPERPLVSVIMPTYCRAGNGMLERAINSVLAQQLEDFELLVIDDGSQDGSEALIKRFGERDPRVVHVRHERNSGLPALRVNEGIELSRGQYLAFQFDDDRWRPNALQALVCAQQQQAGPAVVVGHAQFEGDAWRATLPAVAVDLVTLYEQNRFANNSVLLPRSLVDQFGLYDCHIGMRRLCDWDLWLRYVRHVPFVVIDTVISDVFQGNPASLGTTVPWDISLFRYLHDIPRNALLTPARWRDYEVDALRIGEVELALEFRERLYEQQIVPYYRKFRHHFPALETAPQRLPDQPKTVLYTKNSYDVSNDATLNHYDALANRRGSYKAYFEPLSQVQLGWPRQADALLLVRTVEDQALQLAELALANEKPLGYYLDDDLLHFHEFGPQYDYLAPGTTYHRNLCESLSQADAVWATNRFIAESVRPHNPRVIPHNNAIPARWLPEAIRPRRPDQPLRIGYVGSAYRREEFEQLWPALVRLSEEYGGRVCFEFWGLDVSGLPALASPVVHQPFTFSYFNYLHRLQQADFDILLTPLLDQPRARLAKSLIKYYEAAVAGALGIFSEVPPYASLPAGLTCFKAANTVDAWYQALTTAVALPPPEFDALRQRMLAHVREEYTEAAQIHRHEAAWRATEFHCQTRAARQADGRPRVMYVLHSAHLGGGEMQLWRRLRLAHDYGIAPIVVIPRVLQDTPAVQQLRERLHQEQIQLELVDYTCFTEPRSPAEFCSDFERGQVRDLLKRCAPALVHTVTFIPTFGQLCAELNIPHVASLYGIDESFTWGDGRPTFTHCAIAQSDSGHYAAIWGDLLGAEKWVAREVTPEAIFSLGQRKHLLSLTANEPGQAGPLRLASAGTVQARKSQLETIEALGQLRQAGFDFVLDIYGYTHFFPDYVRQCQDRIRAYGLEERVHFRGFSDDVAAILGTADVVLSLSTFESFPSAIKEAMAAGVLVVATPVGGVTELVVDGVSGVLCADTSVGALVSGIRRALALAPAERRRITEQARRVARTEFHPQRAANDLLAMYNRALELTHAATPATRATAPAVRRAPSTGAYLVDTPAAAPAGYVRIVRSVGYGLSPARAGWAGLDVLAITQGRVAQGRLTLNVYASGGQLIRQVAADLSGVHDHTWVPFRFPMIHNAEHQVFRVKFVLSEPGPQTIIALYETAPLERKYRRAMRRLGLPLPGNALYCRMCYVR